jgi:hypothetical protein
MADVKNWGFAIYHLTFAIQDAVFSILLAFSTPAHHTAHPNPMPGWPASNSLD